MMKFNVLYGDEARGDDETGAACAADVARAIAGGQVYVNSPVFTGLTPDQIATLVNWNVKLDGALPAASAASSLSFGMHSAFDRILWQTQRVDQQAAEPATQRGDDGIRAATIALSTSGGRAALSADGANMAYLFGGLAPGCRTSKRASSTMMATCLASASRASCRRLWLRALRSVSAGPTARSAIFTRRSTAGR
ncbi:hypothetical protein [Cereibacter changlensis]|uniref:hypothetical protein n=1 Tax=Cereibacter changlensis TaxID=402884 RepID=UPI0040333BCE